MELPVDSYSLKQLMHSPMLLKLDTVDLAIGGEEAVLQRASFLDSVIVCLLRLIRNPRESIRVAHGHYAANDFAHHPQPHSPF